MHYLFLLGNNLHFLLQQGGNNGGGAAAALGVIMPCLACICVLILVVPTLAGMWKMFTKAGKPGWAAIVPIYNILMLLEIVGRPTWWIVLFFVIVGGLIVPFDLAKSFGKGTGFGVGLLLLPFVFYPMLGFGDAKYGGPSVAAM